MSKKIIKNEKKGIDRAGAMSIRSSKDTKKKRNCRKMRGKKEKKSTGKVEREPENI